MDSNHRSLAYEASELPLLYSAKLGTPNRIRTGVLAVKGRYPWPLDDGCIELVGTEGIEPNCQPPCILRQRIYSPPQGTAPVIWISDGRETAGIWESCRRQFRSRPLQLGSDSLSRPDAILAQASLGLSCICHH